MNASDDPGFFDRTLSNLRSAWHEIAVATGLGDPAAPRPDLPEEDARRLAKQMHECLEAKGGEASALARAATLGHAYLALEATGRARFLALLAGEFDTDPEAVDGAIAGVREATDPVQRRRAEAALAQSLVAPRVRLLTQFNALPEGVKFLVDMRADLIPLRLELAELAALDADLKRLLTAWFDIGFLEMRQITWDSPATLLEKLIAYEAVHAIQGWSDLKNRLASDRRCFAFFHPSMPDEPLIFVEVALVHGLADNIQDLLDEEAPELDPGAADTAIFYSISNAQRGLSGISFGGFLIKRVVDQLAHDFPGLKNFATLSPVPGFRLWLDAARATDALPAFADPSTLAVLDDPNWADDPDTVIAVHKPLAALCAHYLLVEKRQDSIARDAVAHFHLVNGARLERLNWLGDRSPKGLEESAGIMINYRYSLNKIEENHEKYTGEGQIAASSQVRALLRK